jgi:hypothetical protein
VVHVAVAMTRRNPPARWSLYERAAFFPLHRAGVRFPSDEIAWFAEFRTMHLPAPLVEFAPDGAGFFSHTLKSRKMNPNLYPPALAALFAPSPAAEMILNLDRVAKRAFPTIDPTLFPPMPAIPAVIDDILKKVI